jgi:hypothetical protein
MIAMKRGWMLVSVLLALLAGCAECAVAQTPLAVTTVQDTVYTASGATASGTVLVSWSGFTTASGAVVPAGTTSATIGTGGLLSITLAPNAGATPIGSYYTATFHLSDGSTSREYWVIPVTVAGAPPVKLAAIQNNVLPTSVAMQTVSKAYVDTSIALAVNAARVPIFGPSGSGHAPGIVPDPGLTTGASRYLREDGTWDTPPGGGLGTMATQNASAVAITGGTVTIGAPGCVQTAFGVNGCNLPLANYTATTNGTVLIVPASPSGGGNYCVSLELNTSVAGTGSGTVAGYISWVSPAGGSSLPQWGPSVDLTAISSSNTVPANSSNNVCFTAKASSSITYVFGVTGTVVGYTYQGAIQVTYMGP